MKHNLNANLYFHFSSAVTRPFYSLSPIFEVNSLSKSSIKSYHRSNMTEKLETFKSEVHEEKRYLLSLIIDHTRHSLHFAALLSPMV